jgi:hypothetical protein
MTTRQATAGWPSELITRKLISEPNQTQNNKTIKMSGDGENLKKMFGGGGTRRAEQHARYHHEMFGTNANIFSVSRCL